MRKFFLVCIVFMTMLGAVFAETHDSPLFSPLTPEVTAQGSSFTAVAKGYNSLFTNPAGFAREGGSFTLLSATATPYFIPSSEDMDALQTLGDAPEDAVGDLSELITTNGFGAGISGGIGLVGKGLGIGVVTNADVYGRGKTALGTDVDVAYTTSIIAGLAFPLNIGFADLYLGGDLRYMMRSEIRDVLLTDFIKLASDPNAQLEFDGLSGSGLGIDAGLIAEMGSFSFGLSFRDIGGTTMKYQAATLTEENMQDLLTYSVSGVETSDYRIPMTISYGFGYHPDLGALKWIIDPNIHFEIAETFWDDREPDFWTKVHAGTEIKVLRFLKLRGGINQGYLTAGIGAKLLFLDINASYFTREMSDFPGVRPNQGFSVEAAIRF